MSLCLFCGLCCDGTLFGTAPLEAGEAERLAGRIALAPDGTMLLPCRALDGCRCTVYDDRPAVCRAFNCLALAQLQRGEISEEDARGFIAEVFDRRRRLADELELEDDVEALRQARRLAKEDALSPEATAALERLARALFFLNLEVAP